MPLWAFFLQLVLTRSSVAAMWEGAACVFDETESNENDTDHNQLLHYDLNECGLVPHSLLV